MNRFSRIVCVLAATVVVSALGVVPALAGARPVVTGLSTHRGPYWGGTSVTVTGANFTGVQEVLFGAHSAWSVDVLSPTTLTATVPYHGYGRIYVRVVTSVGPSSRGPAAAFTFTRPSMDDPIQGGMSAHQEQQQAAKMVASHRNVRLAPTASHWTAAMGTTAMNRALSWIGTPYSWDGGNGSGPSTGVCAHNGGDLDCHVVGFDCSGLALYSWWPYEHLDHHAATQYSQAGRFHPAIGQLVPGDLVYFSGYIADGIGHTAIYAGNGMVVQAPESGHEVDEARLVDVIADNGAYRGATRPMTTGRQGSGPVVTSVTPNVASSGGQLIVTGSGLAGTASVGIAGTTVYSFVQRSNTRLVLNVPAHAAGTVTVAVSNAWGTAHRSLTYVAAPQLTAIGPAGGPIAGGTTVTVSGRNLSTVTTATVGGVAVPVDVLGSTRASLVVPAHAAGSVAVVLGSPYGASNALTYTYLAPAPVPSTTAPTAPGTSTPGTSTVPTSSSAPSRSPAPTGSPSTTTRGSASSSSSPSSASPSSSSPAASAPRRHRATDHRLPGPRGVAASRA